MFTWGGGRSFIFAGTIVAASSAPPSAFPCCAISAFRGGVFVAFVVTSISVVFRALGTVVRFFRGVRNTADTGWFIHVILSLYQVCVAFCLHSFLTRERERHIRHSRGSYVKKEQYSIITQGPMTALHVSTGSTFGMTVHYLPEAPVVFHSANCSRLALQIELSKLTLC